ncbi:cysteine ABC transporter substrate-binding protein [Cupriavidus sp. SK-4]|uniref:transporter substrate-binding domain-containing protein n=1 Tax=Cupriavidus sp. SK-4 TaxID=574750 RepID=UPI0004451E31|nr:transporter substrate-binding domain-containing protein [Cupriavidus sp. SK-4]EYS91846.1 cysteine ABC transporter substrate-binding protein [Cupriavidus sp. SK-4]
MKSLKLLLQSACIATLLIVTAPAVHAEDLLDSVKVSGVLKVGMEGTYPPFGYRNGDGQLDGFDVAVAKAVADKMGLKVQFITTEWSGIIAGLQAGKFDVIVNQVGITPARRQALDFTQPYVYSAVQVLQRNNDRREFNSLEELKGKSVGVTLGSNYAELAKSVPGILVQTYPGTSENLRDLAAGRIDAALNDRLMLPYLIKNSKMPLRTGALLAGTKLEMGIPFRKGNPKFAKAIDDALNALQQDGTLRKLSIQWLGTDASRPVAQ